MVLFTRIEVPLVHSMASFNPFIEFAMLSHVVTPSNGSVKYPNAMTFLIFRSSINIYINLLHNQCSSLGSSFI